MIALSREEILTGLKKLGINTPSELNICFIEYREYYIHFISSSQEKVT